MWPVFAFSLFRVFAVVLLLALSAGAAEPRPDIVLIVADNLGHGDLSCYGCPDIATPNIDRLASQGVRFTNFYANGPECTPTRTALLTGRYQQRAGGLECAIGSGNVGRYDDAVWLAEQHQLGLPAAETTIARLLKQSGYRTVGLGKWHREKGTFYFSGFERGRPRGRRLDSRPNRRAVSRCQRVPP